MLSTDYKIKRENIYVGKVVKVESLEITPNAGKSNNIRWVSRPDDITVNKFLAYRSMIFTPDNEVRANDLLYNSSHYPIRGLTKDEEITTSSRGEIVLKDAYNLDLLLRYFDFPETLTYEDIVKIRQTFFNSDWVYENIELFRSQGSINGYFPEYLMKVILEMKDYYSNEIFRHFLDNHKSSDAFRALPEEKAKSLIFVPKSQRKS